MPMFASELIFCLTSSRSTSSIRLPGSSASLCKCPKRSSSTMTPQEKIGGVAVPLLIPLADTAFLPSASSLASHGGREAKCAHLAGLGHTSVDPESRHAAFRTRHPAGPQRVSCIHESRGASSTSTVCVRLYPSATAKCVLPTPGGPSSRARSRSHRRAAASLLSSCTGAFPGF